MADLTGKTLGNYEIIKLLGKGGMAVVYLARQTNMKREVAVKVIESDLAQSAEFVRRFEREVDTIASFSNAHILKVFDYGKDEGMVYLVMELLRGGSLADKIRMGPMPLPLIRKLLNQIASALDYAHRRGIVHRDLKPQNVMLDEDGNAFLTDFGIAKVMSGGTTITMATSAGAILGTPAYMAPEQWKSQPVDARTDIYALGIMLYEMLTGSLPFASDTAYGLMHKHVNEEPPIRTMDRRFASGIERVLLKAMQKNPDDRYSSSMQLVREFEAAIQRHGLVDVPYADSAMQESSGGIELIELEPLDFDDSLAKRPTEADILRPISPMSQTNLKTGTISLKPEAVTPPPPPPSQPAATPPSSSRSPLPIILAVVGVLVLAGLGAVLLSGRGGNPTPTTAPTEKIAALATDAPTNTVTVTQTPSSTFTITPTATATDEPGVQTQVALTLTERATQTLLYEASYTKTPTPNRQQTAAALISQMDTQTAASATANAIASYTKTPTSTFTATKTATATNTATTTFTPTATFTATLTATSTLTPTPCVITTTANNVRAHLGPSRQRNVIGNLVPGDKYTALERAVDSDGNAWVQISFRNQQLWVMLSDATSSGDCDKISTFAVTSTPSHTPTSRNTATPSITPPPDAVCVITTTASNVRAHLGPSRQRNVIGNLSPNTPYVPSSRVVDSDKNTWVQITLRNQQLWVMLSDVTVQGDCDKVPLFTATQTPTPTITVTLSGACVITTTASTVRAHLGPSRQRNVIGNLSPNTPYTPISRATDSDGNKWVQIPFRSQQLWVMLSDVTVQGDCDQLPAAAVSQAITSTATRTRAASATAQPSATATITFTATKIKPSATNTATLTPTKVLTATPSITRTVTRTSTATASVTRTRTSSPSPTINPTATATVATAGSAVTSISVQSGTCVIMTKEVNSVRVHLGPSRRRNVMGFLSANTPYTAISGVVDADKLAWVEVKLNTKQGWVALEDVTTQGDCALVPTPTATVAK